MDRLKTSTYLLSLFSIPTINSAGTFLRGQWYVQTEGRKGTARRSGNRICGVISVSAVSLRNCLNQATALFDTWSEVSIINF